MSLQAKIKRPIGLEQIKEILLPDCGKMLHPLSPPCLYKYLQELEPGETYLETGVWFGCSMTLAVLATPPGVKVVGVDDGSYHGGGYANKVKETLTHTGVWDQVEVHVADANSFVWAEPIHFLYIDDGHDYHSTMVQEKNLGAQLEKGGILAVDNYGDPFWREVKKATDDFLEEEMGNYLIEEVVHHLLIARRT